MKKIAAITLALVAGALTVGNHFQRKEVSLPSPPASVVASLPDEVLAALPPQEVPSYDFQESVAWNAAQQFSVRYAANHGMRLKGEGWDVRMRYSEAREGALPEAEGDRLAIAHQENISEWWVNTPAGVEHGFTLDRPEAGNRVELKVETALEPEVSEGGSSIEFRDLSGEVRFRYSGLRVVDARGKSLPSKIELDAATPHSWKLALVADVSGAHYPLTVDPLMSVPTGRLAGVVGTPIVAGSAAGYAVAISGDLLVVGVPDIFKLPADRAGRAVVFRFNRSIQRWAPEETLEPPIRAEGETFGIAVDVEGSRVAVGAPGAGIGRAFVFANEPGTTDWSLESTVAPNNLVTDNSFGSAVALGDDHLYVGAPSRDEDAAANSGAVEWFHRSAEGSWDWFSFLTPDEPEAGGLFGISLSASGNRVACGAPGRAALDGTPGAGTAFIFSIEGAVAVLRDEVSDANARSGAQFGVSLSLDDTTLLVGSPRRNWQGDLRRGIAEIFERDAQTGDWNSEAILDAPDGTTDDGFGRGVAISGDTAIVGAPEQDDGREDRGAAYIFERYAGGASPGVSTWGYVEKRLTFLFVAGINAGFAVAASGDRFIISSPTSPAGAAANVGSVETFSRRSDRWRPTLIRPFRAASNPSPGGEAIALDGGYLATGRPISNEVSIFRRSFGRYPNTNPTVITPPQEQEGQQFGASIAMEDPWLLIGAPGWDGLENEDSGRCYLYLRTEPTEWLLVGTYSLPSPETGAMFGSATAIGNRWFAASAPGSNTPAVRIYDRLVPEVGTFAWGFAQEFTNFASSGFGKALTLTGNTLAVGSPDQGAGNTRIYEFSDGPGATQRWNLLSTITYSGLVNPDLRSGSALALRGDLLAIGEPGDPSGGRVVVRERNRGGEDNWGIRWNVAPPEANAEAGFGSALAMSDRFIAIGAPGWEESGSPTGATFVFDPTLSGLSTTDVAPQDKLLTADALAGDRAGSAVAVDGIEIATGLPGADAGTTIGVNIGAIGIFTRQWWAWTPSLFTRGDTGEQLGFSVSISGDYSVIAAPFESIGGNAGAGSVTIRKRNPSGNGFVGTEKKLFLTDAAIGDNFGKSVSIAENTILVGAPGDDGGEGAAYLFERNEGGPDNWGLARRFAHPSLVPGDDFGENVALDASSADVAAIAAPGRATNTGSLFLYGNRRTSNSHWVFNEEVIAPGLTAQSFFGTSLAAEGHRVLAGASLADFDLINSGSAHLFGRTGEDTWGLTRTFLAPIPETGSRFAASVAIDGELVIIGAPSENRLANNSGAAYIFGRNTTNGNPWRVEHILTANFDTNPTTFANQNFGTAVAISGPRAAVSAPGTDIGATGNAGAVYLFGQSNFDRFRWGQIRRFFHPSPTAGDQLGRSLAMQGTTIIAGAPLWDATSPILTIDQGAIFTFTAITSAYDLWHAAHHPPGTPQDPLADTDFDGLIALQEAYLNSDPNTPTPDGFHLQTSLRNNTITLRWREGKETNGTIARVTTSTDLITWHAPSDISAASNLRSNSRTVGEGSTYIVREISIPRSTTGPRLFFRIEVNRQ